MVSGHQRGNQTGDHAAELAGTAECFDKWRELQAQYDERSSASAISPGELEFLQFQLRELEQAEEYQPRLGEIACGLLEVTDG